MLIIRFARRGRKKFSFFDLVVAEKTQAVQKKFIEKLGYLNPHTRNGEGEFVFEAEKIKTYLKNGAQLSQRAARELAKAGIKEAEGFIIARPTKPKKEPPKAEEKPAETSETGENEPESSADTTPEDTKTEASEAPAPESEKTPEAASADETQEEKEAEKKED